MLRDHLSCIEWVDVGIDVPIGHRRIKRYVISAARAYARAAGQSVVRQQSIGRRHHGWENKCQNICKDTWHAMHGMGRRPNGCSSGLAKAGFNGTMTAPRLLRHARRERNNTSGTYEFVLVCTMGECKNEKLVEVMS